MILAAALALLIALRKKRPLRGLLPLTGGLLVLCVVFSGAERMVLTRTSIVSTDGAAVLLIDSGGRSYAVNCGLGAAGATPALLRSICTVGDGAGWQHSARHIAGGACWRGDLAFFAMKSTSDRVLPRREAGRPGGRTAFTPKAEACVWGSARVELIPLGGTSCAVRVLLPHLTLLDLTQAAAIDYVTYEDGELLTGDIAVVTQGFLADSPAAERLLHAAGCRAGLRAVQQLSAHTGRCEGRRGHLQPVAA